MKKLKLAVVAATITISCGLSANAQSSSDKISFGAKAGMNFANFTGDTEDTESRISYHIGGMAELMISEKFAFQPELLYSSQGAKYSEENFSSTLKFDYLYLPIMAKYYVYEGLSIEAGPQIGLLLSAENEYEYYSTSGSEDVKELYSSLDFGLNFGLGYKLDNGLNFNLRYNLGLSNVYDAEEDLDEDFSIKNSVFQISLGYFF